jgi:glycosyltransferase involved in cell wall biosynthesis
LLGYVARADMPAVLAAVDAAPVPQVRTSFTESQVPAKLLDAMAMAKPVVASRVGDIAEILGNGSRGWLFEPGDGGGLARALGEIAEKPAEAQRRGQAAREWYLKEASATVTATRICALLEEVTGREVSKMSTDGVES